MRFSIRSILVLTAFVALVVGAIFVFPPVFGTFSLILANAVFAASLLAGAVYGRRGLRAFCIGAAAVAIPGAGTFAMIFAADLALIEFDANIIWGFIQEETKTTEVAHICKIYTVLFVFMALPAGLTGMVVRWWLRPVRRGINSELGR